MVFAKARWCILRRADDDLSCSSTVVTQTPRWVFAVVVDTLLSYRPTHKGSRAVVKPKGIRTSRYEGLGELTHIDTQYLASERDD